MKVSPDEKPLFAIAGDLNGDGIEDVVVVTQTKKDDAKFIIYLSDEKGSIKQFFSSETTLGFDEGPLGFSGVPAINNGILSIIYETSGVGAFSSTEFKLRWNKKDSFKIIGYTHNATECKSATGNCVGSENIDINFSTKKMIKGKRKCQISSDSAQLTLDDISESYEAPPCAKK